MHTPPKDLFTNAATLKAEPVKWLWPGRIPLGRLTLIAGDPGVGKSTIATDVAARTSAGLPWPDHDHRAEHSNDEHTTLGGFPILPAQVIYLTAQEDLAATLLPRLEACGAVHERVIAASATPDIDACLDQLEALISNLNDVRLVIFDPLAAYLRQFESSRGQQARKILDTLTDLAAEHQTAIVGLTHKTRAQRGLDVACLSASVGITAAARAIWTIKPDPHQPGRQLFLPTKTNLAPATSGLAFRIEPADSNRHVAQPLWENEPVAITNLARSQTRKKEPNSDPEVDAWLLAKLAAGPYPTGQLKSDANLDGFSWIAVRRAKARLNVQSKLLPDELSVYERWHWQLSPTQGDTSRTNEPTGGEQPEDHEASHSAGLVAPPVSAPQSEPLVEKLVRRPPDRSAIALSDRVARPLT